MTPSRQWNLALRFQALQWLRYKQRCPIVCCERPAFEYERGSLRPDALGITRGRQLIEVEIKVSATDLRQDAKKPRFTRYAHGRASNKVRKYYLVPPRLLALALEVVPQECGVLVPEYSNPRAGAVPLSDAFKVALSVKRSSARGEYPRLKFSDCVRMAENQSGTLVSIARELAEIGQKITDATQGVPTNPAGQSRDCTTKNQAQGTMNPLNHE